MASTDHPENAGLERYVLRLALYVVMGISVVMALGGLVSPGGMGAGDAGIIFSVCLAGLAASARDVIVE